MKFSQKIAKLGDPSTVLWSLKRSTLRYLFPLRVERFLKCVDREELNRIQQKYAVKNPGDRWPKYTDAENYLKLNIRRVQDMEIQRSRPLRILDIGSGAGYFLFVCKVLGHSGFGLDLPEPEFYNEMFQLFGLKRGIHRVEKFQPLPDTGAKYDLITAFQIMFNEHSSPQPWGGAEWDYFLNDASQHLVPGGRVYLSLNPQPDGKYYSDELRSFFLSKGAKIDHRNRIIFPPKAS